jgi:hypothetical protein
LESQIADVLKQLEIKQSEHGALLRTLIERHHVEPITTVTPKRGAGLFLLPKLTVGFGLYVGQACFCCQN